MGTSVFYIMSNAYPPCQKGDFWPKMEGGYARRLKVGRVPMDLAVMMGPGGASKPYLGLHNGVKWGTRLISKRGVGISECP